MNLVKHIDQYEEECVYFGDPIKNNVMPDGFFIRIIYSTPTFILNGINLYITLNDINLEKYYNKYKCFFNINSHKKLIELLQHIESVLLKKSNIRNKIPQFKVYEQLSSGNIKFFLENTENINNTHIHNENNKFILKISGIWETDTHYGLTYKFFINLGNMLQLSVGIK